MSLFWPGDQRAGALMSDWALLTAMESVEHTWLEALVEHKIAPAEAQSEVRGLLNENDLAALADGAEAGGNPVIVLVQLLRERLSSEPARWVHRGLTSQDVLDTALMICLRDVLDRLDDELRGQVEGLRGLVSEHRSTPMVGRTLTQHAVPITSRLRVTISGSSSPTTSRPTAARWYTERPVSTPRTFARHARTSNASTETVPSAARSSTGATTQPSSCSA